MKNKSLKKKKIVGGQAAAPAPAPDYSRCGLRAPAPAPAPRPTCSGVTRDTELYNALLILVSEAYNYNRYSSDNNLHSKYFCYTGREFTLSDYIQNVRNRYLRDNVNYTLPCGWYNEEEHADKQGDPNYDPLDGITDISIGPSLPISGRLAPRPAPAPVIVEPPLPPAPAPVIVEPPLPPAPAPVIVEPP